MAKRWMNCYITLSVCSELHRNLRNETEMKYYLCKYSPLTVSVNARAWQDYDGKRSLAK